MNFIINNIYFSYNSINMKKRQNYDAINDKEKRNITFCKRKKGVVKKAIQLSKLCELDIFIVIFDRQK